LLPTALESQQFPGFFLRKSTELSEEILFVVVANVLSGKVEIRGDFLEELSHDLARVCFPD
jgi:hypothetical protein